MYDCSIHCGLSLLMCIPGLFNEQCAEHGQCVQVFRLGIIWLEGLWVLWLSHVCLPCVIIVCISGLSTALSSALHLCIVHSIIQCIVPEYCPQHCPEHCLVIMLNQVQKGGLTLSVVFPLLNNALDCHCFAKYPLFRGSHRYGCSGFVMWLETCCFSLCLRSTEKNVVSTIM